MKIRLLKAYGLAAAGDILDPAEGVAKLLIHSGRAVAVDDAGTDLDAVPALPQQLPQWLVAVDDAGTDLDADGQDEGGEDGTKKAFSKPPKTKKK